MRHVYLFVFLLYASFGWAQSLSVRLEFLPPQPGEEFCFRRIEAKSVYLIVAYEWVYQSQNGWPEVIAGVTSSTIKASRSGDYMVKVTDASGMTAISGRVGTYFGEQYRPVITSAKAVICPNGTVDLVSNDLTSTRRYQWYRDGTPIEGATRRTYVTSEAGTYTFRLTDAVGCTSGEAIPVVLTLANPPTGQITGAAELCPGTGNRLSVSATGSQPVRYQWTGDQTVISQATNSSYLATTAGTYHVLFTDADGCTGRSAGFVVERIQQVTVQLFPIVPQCALGGVVSLSGVPAGGTFNGPGVVNGQFNPAQVGAGTYPLTYTVAGPSACLSGTASQAVVVQAAPRVAFDADLQIRRGESVSLPGPIGAGYQYTWTPAATLSDPAQANPIATPASNTTYKLQVRNAVGCTATDTLRVYVQTPIYVPTAFTPNGDGVNDTWELMTADASGITVTVFNRWGDVVFNSPQYLIPFNGEGLDSGIYTYLIQYGVPVVRLAGTLMMLR